MFGGHSQRQIEDGRWRGDAQVQGVEAQPEDGGAESARQSRTTAAKRAMSLSLSGLVQPIAVSACAPSVVRTSVRRARPVASSLPVLAQRPRPQSEVRGQGVPCRLHPQDERFCVLRVQGRVLVPTFELVDNCPMVRQSFLELLEAEAPPDAFYEQLRIAERDGGQADELERLREELAVAMRVRSNMARQRQRQSELRALFESANDLTAIRDVDAVLSAIVRRARQLLSSDLGYLSLVDPERGDCYIKITEGSQTPTFPTLRLPLGSGVLGMVIRTATPYSTDDYLGDQDLIHLDHVDRSAGEEGIRAVLGVPLVLNGAVIGALLAAQRTPRRFSHDEVALLESLGAHAVVALENARLFEETSMALQELNDANAEVRAHSQSLELAASAHDRLAQVLLEGGRVADVAAVIGGVLDGRVWVLDSDGMVLAAVGADPADCAASTVAAAVARALVSGGVGEVVSDAGEVRYVAVARAGSEHLATMVLGRAVPLSDADRRVLDRGAVVTALLMMFQRSVAEAEHRVRGELLDDVLSAPRRDPHRLRDRARRYRADLDVPHVVLVARLEGVDRHRGAAVAARLAAERHGLAGLRGDDVVLAVPGQEVLPAGRWLAERLRGGVKAVVTVGVAGPANGPDGIASAFREAEQCLAVLLALDRRGDVADGAGLGVARFLLAGAGKDEVDQFMYRMLGPVMDYDARRGTQLVATLDAWFAAGGLAGAAERVHAHANTVRQRLERATVLLGPDWRQSPRALDIQIALRVWRLRNVSR
ncbi:helix-turn-helix domain-containing protein [Plantactinospora sp. GCM10030261]|uniref:helix-turn-helix domain-containing protein n=1 Tax=Plantactinospora sp. GCM10030261 TaxID=3273420 RepID=UPI003612FDDF